MTAFAENPLSLVFLISLFLGFLTGIIMHRSDYCITGMFRDLILFKHTLMIRTLLLLVLISMVLFESARQFGLVIYPFPPTGSPSFAAIIGGLIFGIGMVLSGGCVVGTLYKIGSGRILSLTAFIGIVIGSAFYAEVHPLWAAFIKKTTFFDGKKTLPQILGVNPLILISIFLILGIFFLRRGGTLKQQGYVHGYLQPWKAAVLLAFIGLVSYIAIGKPMGVTTGYTKLGSYVESIFFRSHVDSLAFFTATPLNYIHPLTNIRFQGGAGPRFDAISAIELPVIIGIISGSAISAISLREFRIYLNAPYKQYISAFSGGILLGLASRLSQGCNVIHLMGGLPILTGQSILFLIGLIPGTWIGSRILVRTVLQHPKGI